MSEWITLAHDKGQQAINLATVDRIVFHADGKASVHLIGDDSSKTYSLGSEDAVKLATYINDASVYGRHIAGPTITHKSP